MNLRAQHFYEPETPPKISVQDTKKRWTSGPKNSLNLRKRQVLWTQPHILMNLRPQKLYEPKAPNNLRPLKRYEPNGPKLFMNTRRKKYGMSLRAQAVCLRPYKNLWTQDTKSFMNLRPPKFYESQANHVACCANASGGEALRPPLPANPPKLPLQGLSTFHWNHRKKLFKRSDWHQ